MRRARTSLLHFQAHGVVYSVHGQRVRGPRLQLHVLMTELRSRVKL